jgi:glycogen debranching enzyme
MLMGRYLRASGDIRFCRQEYDHLRRAMDRSALTDTDGDGFIENTSGGHGWIEGGALFPPHAELYLNACWAAAQEEAAHVGRVLGRARDARRWSRGAAATWRNIWTRFPHPVTRFPAFALRRNGRLWHEQTALAAVALAFGRPPAEVAAAVTARLAGPSFLTPAGVRMVARESRLYNPAGYHTGSIWPLFTGWAMLGAMRQGETAPARIFFERNASLFARFSLGHVPEVLHGNTGRPAGVCDHQAWSDAMVVLGAGIPP